METYRPIDYIDIGEIRNSYYQGEKIHFCLFSKLPEAWNLIYMVTEPEESPVLCPFNLRTGCEGVMVHRNSKYSGYEPYLGCSSTKCNFYITRVKFLSKSVLHPQCPHCMCTPTEIPQRPKTLQEMNDEYLQENGYNLNSK